MALRVPGYCMAINLRLGKHPLPKTRILTSFGWSAPTSTIGGYATPTEKGRKGGSSITAGLGVGTDPVSGLGRRSQVVQDVAQRRNGNGLRDSCFAQTGPEGLPCEVGGHLVLRQEQARNSSARSEHKHGRWNCRGGIAYEIPGSRHQQPVDVRAALRLPDSEGVDQAT